jgi:hypothetical protein
MNDTKLKIAKLIAGKTVYKEYTDYQEIIEFIYNNTYTLIFKCPIRIFILGLVDSFITKDLEHANKILTLVKEVVKDILEVSGFECTFTDEDWDNLVLIPNERQSSYNKWVLPKIDKEYMSEFFE